MRATGLSIKSLADVVAAEYMARTAQFDRVIEFHVGTTAASTERALKLNGQIVSRYMDETVKTFPADLEEAWVAALPQPHRDELVAELAGRYGLLAARRPVANGSSSEQIATLAACCIARPTSSQRSRPHARTAASTATTDRMPNSRCARSTTPSRTWSACTNSFSKYSTAQARRRAATYARSERKNDHNDAESAGAAATRLGNRIAAGFMALPGRVLTPGNTTPARRR